MDFRKRKMESQEKGNGGTEEAMNQDVGDGGALNGY